jgi:hypothetical protein
MVSSGVGRLPSTLTSKFANHWHILGSRSRISDMLTKPLRNQVQSYSVVSSRSNVDTAANKELYLDHNSSKVIMSGWLDAVDDGNTADRWAHVLTSTNAGTVLDRDTSTRCLLALMEKQANPELGIHHTLNSTTSSTLHRHRFTPPHTAPRAHSTAPLLSVCGGVSKAQWVAFCARLDLPEQLLPTGRSDENDEMRAARVLKIVQHVRSVITRKSSESRETASLTRDTEHDWVLNRPLSAKTLTQLRQLTAPVLKRNDEAVSVRASIEAGYERFNSARYVSFPDVSFWTKRSPDDLKEWDVVPKGLDEPGKWGVSVPIDLPGKVWAKLSPMMGHDLNMRLDLAASSLVQSRPRLVASALVASSDPDTALSPIRKQPAEAWTLYAQVDGERKIRCFDPKTDQDVRSTHHMRVLVCLVAGDRLHDAQL